MYTIFHFHPLNINSCSTGLSLDFIFCVWNRKRDSHAHNKHTQFLKGWGVSQIFGIWNLESRVKKADFLEAFFVVDFWGMNRKDITSMCQGQSRYGM